MDKINEVHKSLNIVKIIDRITKMFFNLQHLSYNENNVKILSQKVFMQFVDLKHKK